MKIYLPIENDVIRKGSIVLGLCRTINGKGKEVSGMLDTCVFQPLYTNLATDTFKRTCWTLESDLLLIGEININGQWVLKEGLELEELTKAQAETFELLEKELKYQGLTFDVGTITPIAYVKKPGKVIRCEYDKHHDRLESVLSDRDAVVEKVKPELSLVQNEPDQGDDAVLTESFTNQTEYDFSDSAWEEEDDEPYNYNPEALLTEDEYVQLHIVKSTENAPTSYANVRG